MNKIIFSVFIFGLVFLAACTTQQPDLQPIAQETPAPGVSPDEVEEMVVEPDGSDEDETKMTETTEKSETVTRPVVKEITMTARQWEFDPDTIRVKQGENVRLVITSIDVSHGFAINAYNIDERLIPGQTAVVEFLADKTGTFRFYCSVLCGSGHSRMDGTLVVE